MLLCAFLVEGRWTARAAKTTQQDCLKRLPATFTYSQARRLGISDWTLYRLRDERLIEPLGRGLYERADLAEGDQDLLAIAARASRATLCLRSALARHGLIDDIPATIDIALPRGTRTPALDGPISWHHFDAATFDLGRDRLDLAAGQKIGIYNAERCIVDAFRLSGIEGPELGNEALRSCRGPRRRSAGPFRSSCEAHP
ncbi:hypothetical protein HC028_04205 [Planosporangium flavigriseum]|uniref:AbiEi antitoxin N-terminal domain-containing protein n=1 Tax=Planosporangium flavigriseum TaxID=373681 RepID=A0A8J3LUD9_9ACTN|nr:type IV toxin-antitoxin system AbiEi family antitoxin domain-containing protein [Planosporangium flavigriseum]NJC63714.1 hypothetical protein [Planosporangium flavigriseum]GIG73791.1 hypothetical protein Pfl04_21950 [Planosporangium flavigriseum]